MGAAVSVPVPVPVAVAVVVAVGWDGCYDGESSAVKMDVMTARVVVGAEAMIVSDKMTRMGELNNCQKVNSGTGISRWQQ